MVVRSLPVFLSHHYRSYSVRSLVPKYDAVIVGGGMVGFGLAAVAAHSKLFGTKKILLLEGSVKSSYKRMEEYENRVVALNDLSVKMLKNIGAWEFIQSHRAQPVNKMTVWETMSGFHLTFRRNPLAHIVENNLVVESLRNYLESIKDTANVTILYEAQAENIRLPSPLHPEHLVRLDIQQKSKNECKTVETDLIIGADGFNSSVRKTANIHTIGWNHSQKAIVATLRLGQTSEESVAWQRFLPTGPIALLPLSKEYSSLVWSTTMSEADRLMALNDSDFIQALNDCLVQEHYSSWLQGGCIELIRGSFIGLLVNLHENFSEIRIAKPSQQTSQLATVFSKIGQCFGGIVDYLGNQSKSVDYESYETTVLSAPHVDSIQPNTKRACYPLGFQHATVYSAPRLALVGDSAHRILPLAGQGVNLGFGDVVSLVAHLEEAIRHGADIGSAAYLKDYTNERQRIVVPLAGTLELINLLYSTDAYCNQSAVLSCEQNKTSNCQDSTVSCLVKNIFSDIRGAGMSTVQSSELLKKILMEVAVTGKVQVPSSEFPLSL